MEVSFSLSCLLPSFLTYKRTHRHLLWCLDEEAPEGPPQTDGGGIHARSRTTRRTSFLLPRAKRHAYTLEYS